MMTKSLLDAAMNAATLARSPVGEPAIGPSVGLSAEDVKRARDILTTMPEDPLTTAFDRRDYLIAHDWRPAQATNNQQSRERELIGHVLPIFDELFAEVVDELRESHSDLEDSEIVAAIKENVRDDFQATGDALQDHLQLCGAVEKEIERAEFTDKLRM